MYIKNFIKIFVILILIDIIWIKVVAGKVYKNMIRDIQKEELKVKVVPAVFVYVVMALLLLLFGSTNIRNFLLGFLSYGIYDLTNLALINKFDAKFAILDMIWGGFLFMATYYIMLRINI